MKIFVKKNVKNYYVELLCEIKPMQKFLSVFDHLWVAHIFSSKSGFFGIFLGILHFCWKWKNNTTVKLWVEDFFRVLYLNDLVQMK